MRSGRSGRIVTSERHSVQCEVEWAWPVGFWPGLAVLLTPADSETVRNTTNQDTHHYISGHITGQDTYSNRSGHIRDQDTSQTRHATDQDKFQDTLLLQRSEVMVRVIPVSRCYEEGQWRERE